MSQFQVLGVQVNFPYQQIYPSQRALIANSIRAFKNQENALLESPTGTGKALALLSSSLAYQKYVVDNQINIENDPSNHLIKANDTFAIYVNSNSSQESDVSTSASQNKFSKPRIWYTSRTHQQLKQVIEEYKKLPYNPSMVVLAGRKRLCLNATVLKSNDMPSECRKLMEKNKCPFKMEAGIPNQFRSGGENEKFDVEDLLKYGRKHLRCPYHMSLVILSKADLVFCPYSYILDPKIKGMLELSLVNSILIIDEAHNVENVCRESGTFRASNLDFMIAMKSLSNMKEAIPQEDPDTADLETVTNFLQTVYDWYTNKLKYLRFLRTKEKETIVTDFFKEINLNQVNWTQLQNSMTKIINKKIGEENSNEQMKFENTVLLSNLFVFFVLAFQNNMENAECFKIAFKIGDEKDDFEDYMIIACLAPSVIFKCISREVHSVILASGTLSPLSTFCSELGTQFPIQLSANHIIDKEQVESFIITNATDGTPFISNYQNLMQNKESMFINFGRILASLLREIPGGCLVFLPSYKILNDIVSTWKQKGLWKAINDTKKIFLEDAHTINQVYKKYQQRINNQEGALLMGVCRGSMSEGMDFKDDQARAVFVFGIPYPSYVDIEVKLKKNYNDQLASQYSQSSQSSSQSSQSFQSPQSSQSLILDSQGSSQGRMSRYNDNKPISGIEWYEALAFRSVFQAIGRCIRHKNDYGTIFLIDQRFQSFFSKFPRWVQSSFINHEGIDDIKQKLHTFYNNMQVKYPTKVGFKRGDKITFECAECHTIIVNILTIDFDHTEQTKREGFLKLVEAGNDKNCIFLSRSSRIILNVQPSLDENIWSQEDLSVYQLIRCPQCGQKLGVHILATTLEDSIYMDGYIYLYSKLRVFKEGEKNSKNPKSPNTKNKKKGKNDKTMLVKGQQKLSF